MPDLYVLHGRETSLVLEHAADSAPLWRYWGPRLADGFAAGPALADEPCYPGFHMEPPLRLALFPGLGLGWFHRAALEAHRAGTDFANSPVLAGVDQDGHALTFRLADRVSAIEVAVRLALDPETDVLSVKTTLVNRGADPLTVQWLASAVLPLPPTVEQVRSYGGRHAGEFALLEDRLGKATWSRHNRHGLTSHDTFPGAVAITAATADHAGLAYAAQLAWSGNHRQEIEPLDDGRRQWQLGLELAPGEAVLAPGESLAAPEVLATCSRHGWQGAASNFHAAARALVRWPGGTMKPRPVHFNTWEGCYFDHDAPRLMAVADKAAALGIERFVLDDGWFHRRNDDTSSLGDWWPDAAKYPEGLGPLARHVVGLGMEFGLWVEPEMVNPDSDLYRAHPEWALQLAGRPMQTSRHQLVLDLTRQEVADYLFETIGAVLRDLPVSYLKWDHNRDLVAAGTADGKAAYHQQVLALYRLLDRFHSAFPGLEIESCAGGGGRIDMGVLPHVQRFWASDNIDALSRLEMQRGFLQFLPPEVMGSHIGTAPAHTTGRSQSLDFRAAVACQGHLGVELDLARLDEGEGARLAGWIAFYKQWRHLLHQQVWTGTQADGLVWHAAGTADEWLLTVYRTLPTRQRFISAVPLPFVARAAGYAVTRTGPDGDNPALHFDGSWLAEAGLPMPPTRAEQAIIFHGTRR
jgi:alpha-galactosidase